MLSALQSKLTPRERLIIEPIVRVHDRLDVARSTCSDSRGFLTCSFYSPADVRCSFEIGFGRDSDLNHMNFFVGLGAEFCAYESFQSDDDAQSLRSDVCDFLSSTVECELEEDNSGILRARYVVDAWRENGPLEFRARHGLPWRKRSRRVLQYEPWLST